MSGSTLQRTIDWSPGLYWFRDEGGRLRIVQVAKALDFREGGREYWFAAGVWPQGPSYWTELDQPFMALKILQPSSQ